MYAQLLAIVAARTKGVHHAAAGQADKHLNMSWESIQAFSDRRGGHL